MRRVTADSLKDYQMCSLLYEYRHVNKDEEAKNVREKRIEKFDETIKRVCAFFFYKKQAMMEPSYNALLNRWQKLWFSDASTPADIVAMKNEILWGSETSYTTQAAAALLEFYEQFSEKPDEQVVLVDEKFTVPFQGDVVFEGTFDLVTREVNKSGQVRYNIYKWITNNLKKPSSFWAFDFTILAHAFKHRNAGKPPMDIHFYLWDFGSSVPGYKEVILTYDDHVGLSHWTTQMVRPQVYVPRRGLTAYCKSCPFDKACSRWSFSSNEVTITTKNK